MGSVETSGQQAVTGSEGIREEPGVFTWWMPIVGRKGRHFFYYRNWHLDPTIATQYCREQQRACNSNEDTREQSEIRLSVVK